MSWPVSTLNYFDLLELPAALDIDRALLDRRYREQQLRWHPDRFVSATETEKQVALQHTSLVNDAYQVLKSPLQRAEHLLNVALPPSEARTALPVAFLEQQLALREELEEVSSSRDRVRLAALTARLETEVQARWQELRAEVASADQAGARMTFQKLQFLHKLNDDIVNLEERWLDP